MIAMEIAYKQDIELLEKALGCLWAQGEVEADELGAFNRCERAVEHAWNQPHQAGEPTWQR